MALVNGTKLALDCSRIGDTYANAVPIHLEDWLWAGIDYDANQLSVAMHRSTALPLTLGLTSMP